MSTASVPMKENGADTCPYLVDKWLRRGGVDSRYVLGRAVRLGEKRQERKKRGATMKKLSTFLTRK